MRYVVWQSTNIENVLCCLNIVMSLLNGIIEEKKGVKRKRKRFWRSSKIGPSLPFLAFLVGNKSLGCPRIHRQKARVSAFVLAKVVRGSSLCS
jgi:hypothetical protein